jgi:uncharacterized protein VirK/YbjX
MLRSGGILNRQSNGLVPKVCLLLLLCLLIYVDAGTVPAAPLIVCYVAAIWLAVAFAGNPFADALAALSALGRSELLFAAHSVQPMRIAFIHFAIYLLIFVACAHLFSVLYRIALFLRPTDNPLLREELARFPVLREFIFRPYVNSRWTFNERMTAIENHYLLVKHKVPFLGLSTDASLDVTELDLGGEKLRIVLDRPEWMRGEGELGLSLFYGIDRIYTAMFLLQESDGKLQIIVGNVQGDGRDRAALYKEFTKTLFGMRPRDFLVHVMKVLGEDIGCSEILGISDDRHRSAHWLTKAKKVSTYDAIWVEHGGVKDPKSGLFRIPAHFSRRPDADVPANKRAQYRRRYQLMDELQAKIREATRNVRAS